MKTVQAPARILDQAYEVVPIDTLRIHPRNSHHKGDQAGILQSILANGFYGAVIVQRSSGHILAGNYTYLSGVDAGLDEIPVIYVDVSDASALKILLVDNKLQQAGTFDDALLCELVAEVSNLVGLDGTGFDQGDLDRLIDSLLPPEPKPPRRIPDAKFAVIIDCVDMEEQSMLLDRFEAEGLHCHGLGP